MSYLTQLTGNLTNTVTNPNYINHIKFSTHSQIRNEKSRSRSRSLSLSHLTSQPSLNPRRPYDPSSAAAHHRSSKTIISLGHLRKQSAENSALPIPKMSALSRRGMCDLLFLRLQHQSGMLLPPPPSLLNFPNRVTNGEILNGFTWVLRRRSPPYPQRHLLQGFESSKRSLHIFVEQEDDFLELGPTVPQERRTLSKLMTEKPEHYLKAFPSKNAQVSGADFTMKSALQSVCKSSPASCQKPDSDDNPDTISNHRKDVCNNSSNSVSIKNVPSTVNLAQLIKTASIFGKISSARMRTLPSGLSCCDVEFENESSSQRAAIVGVVKVRSNHLPVCPLHTQETCAIRIQSISKKTTDPAIHSLCQSIGALEGLARAGENAVDAIFSMKNNPDIKGILAKLNNTFVDNCRWSAHLLPDTSSSVVKSKYDAAHFGAANDESAVSKILPGIDDRLEAVKANHEMKLIHIEDLKYLHMLVMHLEDV